MNTENSLLSWQETDKDSVEVFLAENAQALNKIKLARWKEPNKENEEYPTITKTKITLITPKDMELKALKTKFEILVKKKNQIPTKKPPLLNKVLKRNFEKNALKLYKSLQTQNPTIDWI